MQVVAGYPLALVGLGIYIWLWGRQQDKKAALAAAEQPVGEREPTADRKND